MLRLQQEEKMRLQRLSLKTGAVLAVGAAYALFVALTGWRIPCLFYVTTELYCPGCGITRMFMALLRLDLAGAAQANLLALCLLPIGIGLFIYKAMDYVKTGQSPMRKAEKWLYMVAFVLCIAFTVMRNTGRFPFLIPPP